MIRYLLENEVYTPDKEVKCIIELETLNNNPNNYVGMLSKKSSMRDLYISIYEEYCHHLDLDTFTFVEQKFKSLGINVYEKYKILSYLAHAGNFEIMKYLSDKLIILKENDFYHGIINSLLNATNKLENNFNDCDKYFKIIKLLFTLIDNIKNYTYDMSNSDASYRMLIRARQHSELLEFLLLKLNVCQKLKDGILNFCIYHGPIDNAKLLITCGADVNNTAGYGYCKDLNEIYRNKAGRSLNRFYIMGKELKYLNENSSPLHIVAKIYNNHDENEMLSLANILILNGAQLNVANRRNLTPLMVACKKKALNLINLYIDNGADINYSINDGCTVLSYITKLGNNYNPITELLISKGAI